MAHEYVKISELVPTTSFGTADQFVIVQNEETVKIGGAELVQSLAALTNLATRSYVDAVVDSAPGTLDTLRELASALNDDANFGSTVTALINEKLPISNFGLEFWNQLASVNTYHIPEGNNLYWTQDRFDSALASKNTYHIAEGSNLYFTEQRVLDVVVPLIPTEFVTSYNDLTDRPVLFSGNYADLSNRPAIPTDIDQLTDRSGLLGQGSGALPAAPTFASVTATQLNVQNVAFTGTGAVTIVSGNDLNLVAAGDITFNGVKPVTSYNELLDKPVLLKGDTGSQGPAGIQGPIGLPGTTDYNELANKPDLSVYATQSYVGTQIADLVSSAPATLDTLNELATALGNDANFATTITTTLGTKADSADLAVVATSGSYTDLINNPVQWQDVSGYIQTGYTFNEPLVSTGSSGGPGSTATEGQLVTYNWANYTNESGIYAYYPGANFANGNIPNPAVQDIKTFAINYQYVSGGASVPSASDWINWGNNLKNASASKFLIVKTTDGKQIVYEITSVTSDSQTNNSQVHQHTINVNFLKFNGGDPAALIKNVTYPPKIFWAGNISTNILNYYLNLTSISDLTNNIVVVAGSNTTIAMPSALTYPGRTIDISNKSVSSLLQIELDLPNNILSDYILVNTFATFKSNGTRWIPVNKVVPNYVQADKASTSMPYGTALPSTVVSGTITTTGGPIRLHISGNCTVNTGGAPVIQFQRGTTGVGRNMTLTNNGSNLPFASECIDAVPAGTYTYSVKVVSGSIGNGAIFYDPVLTIIELK